MKREEIMPTRRQLPKLMACMTKNSMENLRNKLLFGVDFLDAKGIRRRKHPLHECLILELREAGYADSSNYLNDLLYDNAQLVAEDDIGIVVDLRNREDYLEHICAQLQIAEKERDRDNIKKECLTFLKLAMDYAERGKGILWLAEKFFLASIAVASRYMIDGGRQKGCCKYHYAKFLLDKFPGADTEEPYNILTEVRDSSIGKVTSRCEKIWNLIYNWSGKDKQMMELFSSLSFDSSNESLNTPAQDLKPWKLFEPSDENEVVPPDWLFCASALQLHRVLLTKSREVRKEDPAKSERLARLAERRANDAGDASKTAEAIVEVGICQLIMKNLNNAQKTFERAFKIYIAHNDINGLCTTRMHMAAVMQRLGEYEKAATLLTEMGQLAMDHCLTRQLGRALHLLGELHLRRERPELGTQHLTEAFFCFMGRTSQFYVQNQLITLSAKSTTHQELSMIFENDQSEIYEEEAEQSRLMMAISAGQELMASYFALIRKSGSCAVAKIKVIEWKLMNAGWWVKRDHHELMPCMCTRHRRTPLDVLWAQIRQRDLEQNREFAKSFSVMLGRERDFETPNLQEFRSSHYNVRRSLTTIVEKRAEKRYKQVQSSKSMDTDLIEDKEKSKEGEDKKEVREGKDDKGGNENKEGKESKGDKEAT